MIPSPIPTDELLTGERTLPGIWHENYWFRRHEAAYLAALPLARGARVLDAGCGEGYGPTMLADDGADVVGLDLDVSTLQHAHANYPQVSFVCGNLVAMPFADGVFDTVVTLQVVEHLWDQQAFVAECARVTRGFGTLVMSTPNRLTFSPDHVPGESPTNPFHSRELDPREIVELVAPHFDVVTLLGVHHGSRLVAWEASNRPLVDQQLAAPPESWSPALRDVVASVAADDFDVDAERVDACLDLLVVAERRP